MPDPHAKQKLQGLLFLVFVLVGSLFALTGVRQLFIAPLEDPIRNWAWFGMQALPLIAVVPGILGCQVKALLYCALVSLLFFIHGCLLATDIQLRGFGLAEAVIAMLLAGLTSYAAHRLHDAVDNSGE